MECTINSFVAFSAPQAANVQPPEPRSARGEMVQPGGDMGSHCTGHTMPGAWHLLATVTLTTPPTP